MNDSRNVPTGASAGVGRPVLMRQAERSQRGSE